jgi:dTMP kinase
MRGHFITLEGGEGTGKSTQARFLARRLERLGHPCLVTREPGGTPEAESIRNLLVNGHVNRWSPQAEALLNYAARDAHLRSVIAPALSSGKIVVCDRFVDSTRAYQVHAGGAPDELVDALQKFIVGTLMPHLTLVFDLDPTVGLARAKARADDTGDRFESKGPDFHTALRNAFLAIAKAEPHRCRVIDASKSMEAVEADVWQAVAEKLNV